MPDRRAVWLHGQGARDPVAFMATLDGKRREFVIADIATNSMKGYLLVPEDRM